MMKQKDNTHTNTIIKEELDFAVIGAGIAGLTFANKMHSLGFSTQVFEKSRGTGGRISSKKVHNSGQQEMAFDLGCVSFSAKSLPFKSQLECWHQIGVISPWLEDEQGILYYVANSRNSSLTRYLSKHLDCHFSTRITSINNNNGVWKLLCCRTDKEQTIVYANNIVLATPSAQAFDLLPNQLKMKDQLSNVVLEPQWVLAVELNNPQLNFSDVYFPNSEIIHSISIESNKPTRQHSRDSKILQIQTTTTWSHRNLEKNIHTIENDILKELEYISNQSLTVINSYLHRWLYSTVSHGLGLPKPYSWHTSGIGLICDYFDNKHFGIEASWLSAVALANNLADICEHKTATSRTDQDD
ncbi:MAG: NAD(P)-binding protein [Oleispira sp.]|nr:NAD(P)-binding protein [Oleispira sp.]